MITVAALYVMANGPYAGLDGVECWDEARDARAYAGPWPVVAHPPCARWGNYWYGSPSGTQRFQLGADGGCFAAALAAVKRWGGVLEHPAGSRAWLASDPLSPPAEGGWVSAGMLDGGWTCHVEQGHYGHRGRKSTWLYACGVELPRLAWGPSSAAPEPGKERAGRGEMRGVIEIMSKRERTETPAPFRDVLLEIARTARRSSP